MTNTLDHLSVQYDDLEQLAAAYEAQASAIETALSDTNQYYDNNLRGGPTPWTGPSADTFLSMWSNYYTAFQTLPDAMRAAAKQIRAAEATYVETDLDRVRQGWNDFIYRLNMVLGGGISDGYHPNGN